MVHAAAGVLRTYSSAHHHQQTLRKRTGVGVLTPQTWFGRLCCRRVMQDSSLWTLHRRKAQTSLCWVRALAQESARRLLAGQAAADTYSNVAVCLHFLQHHARQVSCMACAFVLAVASRGRNAMKKAMMGSMTDTVIQRVSCPCLVVKPQVSTCAGGSRSRPACLELAV